MTTTPKNVKNKTLDKMNININQLCDTIKLTNKINVVHTPMLKTMPRI